jgi:hypothetical protein
VAFGAKRCHLLIGSATLAPDCVVDVIGDQQRSCLVDGKTGSRLLQDKVRSCRRMPISSPGMIETFEYRDVRRRHDDHQRIFEVVLGREPWRAEMLVPDHAASAKTAITSSLPSPLDWSFFSSDEIRTELYFLARFLHANRYPLRSKTRWMSGLARVLAFP